MTVHNHAIVWVDHRVVKIFYLGLEVEVSRGRAVNTPRGVSFALRCAIIRPIVKSLRWDAATFIWANPHVETLPGVVDVPQCPAWRQTIASREQDEMRGCYARAF
jgi:hypothetical protein